MKLQSLNLRFEIIFSGCTKATSTELGLRVTDVFENNVKTTAIHIWLNQIDHAQLALHNEIILGLGATKVQCSEHVSAYKYSVVIFNNTYYNRIYMLKPHCKGTTTSPSLHNGKAGRGSTGM